MIYTNLGPNPNPGYLQQCEEKGILPIEQFDPSDSNPIFYYDRHDQSIRRVELKDLMTEEISEVFNNNEESLLVINFADDYLNSVDLDRFASDIKLRGIDSSRIVFVLMDKNFEEFLIRGLKERGVNNVLTESINILMKRVPPRYNTLPESTYKFSVFSRNYYSWRLSLFLELINRGILKEVNYSFHNYNPYIEGLVYSLETLKEDVVKEGYELTEEIEEWINKVPYDLGNKSQKWSSVIYDAIDSSDIHIVIESHFDPFLGPNFSQFKPKYDPNTIAPGFLTEKTWKPISCRKPFILAATPYALRDLRKLGYKTFDGIIDESYDTMENDQERMKAIGVEIERINNLSKEAYKEFLNKTKEIVEFNHNLYIQQHESINFGKYPFLHGVVVL